MQKRERKSEGKGGQHASCVCNNEYWGNLSCVVFQVRGGGNVSLTEKKNKKNCTKEGGEGGEMSTNVSRYRWGWYGEGANP